MSNMKKGIKLPPKIKKPTVKVLKKKTWDIFSKYIRLRDCLKTTQTKDALKCISCGRLVKFHECDAGHFISRRFNATLFDERNVNGQCKGCNGFGGNLLAYRRGLIRKYGEGIDIELEDLATEIKKFTPQELLEKIVYYQKKINHLEGK